MFPYDVAISFAGEQRIEAEAIAACLKRTSIKVFYDGYEQATLWGKDLYEHLADVYQHQARYCLMLISAAYAAKVWTNHERRSAQARAFTEKGEYVLPVRFDDTAIPGLPDTISYLHFADHGVEGICKLLLEKLARSPVTRAVTVSDIAAERAYAAPKSAETAEQFLHITQRARASFCECKRTPPFSHGGFWALTFVYQNFGNTPSLDTRIVSSIVSLETSEGNIDSRLDADIAGVDWSDVIAVSVAPHQQILSHSLKLETEKLRLARLGSIRMFACAQVRYRDVFGQPHESSTCGELAVPEDPRSAFEFRTYSQKLNYAD